MDLKIFDIQINVKTAGPSPDNNNRTEVFFFGCKKAMEGKPCKGCFNSPLWDSSVATKKHNPKDLAKRINSIATNKYVSIGGGEPTDQMEGLIELCKELKAYGFHILVYTWHSLIDILDWKLGYWRFNSTTILNRQFKELLKYVDIIVDGQFKIEEKLYKEDAGDGFLSSVGSGNQIIWDISRFRKNLKIIEGYQMKDIEYLELNPLDELQYKLKNNEIIKLEVK